MRISQLILLALLTLFAASLSSKTLPSTSEDSKPTTSSTTIVQIINIASGGEVTIKKPSLDWGTRERVNL